MASEPDEFPPLPRQADLSSALHSRVSSLQSGHLSRSGTPRIPPGFERQATPKIPPGFEDHIVQSKTSGEVEIATPASLNASSPKKSALETTTPILPVVPVIPNLKQQQQPQLEDSPEQKDTRSVNNQKDAKDEQHEAADVDSKSPINTTSASVTKPKPQSKKSKSVEKSTSSKEESPVPSKPSSERADKSEPAADTTPFHDQRTVTTTSNGFTSAGKQSVQSQPEEDKAKAADTALPSNHVSKAASSAKLPVLSSPNKSAGVKRAAPRTLQITPEMIAAHNTQGPLSTTTEKSAPFPSYSGGRQQPSRQPSISISVSRPSTPAISEVLASHDVSRAGSPPPSVIGSAPSRTKTKAQAKRERRNKASEVTETETVIVAPTPPPQEEVAPIVARQKKQKKSKSASKQPALDIKSQPERPRPEPETKKSEQRQEKDVAPVPAATPASASASGPEQVDSADAGSDRGESPAPDTPVLTHRDVKHSYTLLDFLNDSAQIDAEFQISEGLPVDEKTRHNALQELLDQHISPLPELLSEMIDSGEIARDHTLFSAPAFNSSAYKLPTDHRKGQAYLDGNGYTSSDSFGMVYLPSKEKKALYQGHAVSVADSGDRSDDLLKRCLITPSGWVLRHLSRDESEKMLDLEERRERYVEEFGSLGRMDGLGQLEHDDYCNLSGGFDELSRFGEAHGIHWIMGNHNVQRRYARAGGNGLDDDYGLGEAPIDPNAEFDEHREVEDEDDDEEDVDDDGDDEAEAEGEQMVLGAEVDFGDDEFDIDDDDEDEAFDLMRADALPPLPEMIRNVSMPGAWDPDFNSPYASRSHPQGMYSSLNSPAGPYGGRGGGGEVPMSASGYGVNRADLGLRGNTLPPLRHPLTQGQSRDSVLVLRGMDMAELEKTVKERAREIESSRKEAEKYEKRFKSKTKDANKWKELVQKAVST